MTVLNDTFGNRATKSVLLDFDVSSTRQSQRITTNYSHGSGQEGLVSNPASPECKAGRQKKKKKRLRRKEKEKEKKKERKKSHKFKSNFVAKYFSVLWIRTEIGFKYFKVMHICCFFYLYFHCRVEASANTAS